VSSISNSFAVSKMWRMAGGGRVRVEIDQEDGEVARGSVGDQFDRGLTAALRRTRVRDPVGEQEHD
jgi:hypothetical protein